MSRRKFTRCAYLFNDHCHWVAFIQQTQFSARRSLGSWVHENTAVEESAVDISNHGADITQGVRLWGVLAVSDELLGLLIKAGPVAFIDAVNLNIPR